MLVVCSRRFLNAKLQWGLLYIMYDCLVAFRIYVSGALDGDVVSLEGFGMCLVAGWAIREREDEWWIYTISGLFFQRVFITQLE